MATKQAQPETGVPKELREALARREEARAKLRLVESEMAKQRAEIARAKAEIFRADTEGRVPIGSVMRW
jgi:multidrug resistance efflux pump